MGMTGAVWTGLAGMELIAEVRLDGAGAGKSEYTASPKEEGEAEQYVTLGCILGSGGSGAFGYIHRSVF